jgi:hypothetical protein
MVSDAGSEQMLLTYAYRVSFFPPSRPVDGTVYVRPLAVTDDEAERPSLSLLDGIE